MPLQATFAADFSQFTQSLAQATVKLDVFDRATKRAADGLKRSMEGFSGQKVAAEAARMAEAIERTGGATKLTAAELAKSNAVLDEAIEKYKRLGAEAPPQLAKLSAELKKAEANTKSLGDRLTKTGADLKAVGTIATAAITVPIVAGLGLAAKAAIDFESSFAGVRKTVAATEPEFAQMALSFRQLAKEIPVSVHELARLGESAGALGIAKGDIVEFSRVMALVGVTTNVASDQAAESIAQIQTQFQAAGKETENFASALVHLGNNGASTEKDILGLASRLASAGNAANMSQADVLGFAAAMANVGIEAEAGGTALSKTFNEINAAVAKGGAALDSFAKIAGVSAEKFAQSFRTNAAGAVESFIVGLGKIKAEGGNLITTLDDLGITEIRQADTLRRLAQNTDNVTKSLIDARQGWKDNTALSAEAGKRFETVASQLKILQGKLYDITITLGDALLPAINDFLRALEPLVQKVADLAKTFGELPAPVRNTALAVALLAAAMGPVLLIAGQVLVSFGQLAAVFAEGTAGARLAATAFGLLTAPITAVVGAIAGLAIAWASFKDDWTRAFDVLIPPLGLFRTAIDLVSNALAPYMQQLDDIATIASGVFSTAWNIAAAAVNNFKSTLSDLADSALSKLADELHTVAAVLDGPLRVAIDGAKVALKPLVDSLLLLLAMEARLEKWAGTTSKGLHDVAEGFRQSGAQVSPFVTQTQNAAKAMDDLRAALARVNGQGIEIGPAGQRAGHDFVAQLDEIQKKINALKPDQIKQLNAAIAIGSKEAKEYASAIGIGETGLELFSKRAREATTDAHKLGKALSSSVITGDGIEAALHWMEKLTEESEKLELRGGKGLEQIFKFSPDAGMKDFERALDLRADALRGFHDKHQKDITKIFEFEGDPGIAMFQATLDKMSKSFKGTLSAAFKDLPQVIMRAIEGGGDIGKAIGAMFGSSIFGEGSDLVKSLTGGLTKVLGKTIGGAIGAMLPGLGTLLGAGIGALTDKLFGKLFQGKHVNDLRDTFTSAAGGIDELAKRAAAAGLTLEKFYKAKTVKQYEAAIKDLDEAFKTLDVNREKAGNLFDRIMEAGAKGIPAAFRPAIDQLIKLGLLTDEQAEKLRGLGKDGIDVDQMKADIDLFAGRLESLGPAFQQAQLDKTAGQYINAIDRLFKAGADVGGVLFDAREEISKLVQDSIKFGTTIPENMQPWIEELARSGNLVDENGDKIKDVAKLKFGEKLKTEAEVAQEGWEKIIKAIQELVDELRGPLTDAINKVPKDVRIKVGADYDIEPPPLPADSRNLDVDARIRYVDDGGFFEAIDKAPKQIVIPAEIDYTGDHGLFPALATVPKDIAIPASLEYTGDGGLFAALGDVPAAVEIPACLDYTGDGGLGKALQTLPADVAIPAGLDYTGDGGLLKVIANLPTGVAIPAGLTYTGDDGLAKTLATIPADIAIPAGLRYAGDDGLFAALSTLPRSVEISAGLDYVGDDGLFRAMADLPSDILIPAGLRYTGDDGLLAALAGVPTNLTIQAGVDYTGDDGLHDVLARIPASVSVPAGLDYTGDDGLLEALAAVPSHLLIPAGLDYAGDDGLLDAIDGLPREIAIPASLDYRGDDGLMAALAAVPASIAIPAGLDYAGDDGLLRTLADIPADISIPAAIHYLGDDGLREALGAIPADIAIPVGMDYAGDDGLLAALAGLPADVVIPAGLRYLGDDGTLDAIAALPTAIDVPAGLDYTGDDGLFAALADIPADVMIQAGLDNVGDDGLLKTLSKIPTDIIIPAGLDYLGDDGLQRALRAIPQTLTVRVNTELEDSADVAGRLAGGAPGSQRTLSLASMERANAIPQPIHVHVNVDGREAAMAVVPYIPNALNRRGARQSTWP